MLTTNTEGESEIAMGEAIKKYGWKRNDLVITTKVTLAPPILRWSGFIAYLHAGMCRSTGARLKASDLRITVVSHANMWSRDSMDR
jgi:aryl-alcohol dehydrogenase-like predicted oxidoreductase